MATHADISRWPSVATVARVQGVTIQGVYHLLRVGRLDGVRTDVGWLVNPESVVTWAAARQGRAGRQQREASAC
jgi:hypothetical protein